MENRARLACEVIRAVKEEVGGALAVIVRLAGQEYGETDGLTVDEAAAAAKMFEEAGADAIHVTGTALNAFANFTDGPLPDKVGYYTDNATRIKQAISIPVITVGRMLPEVGEKMIAEGRTDFAAMGRQLLADPQLVNKLKDGVPERVRPCINCYVCVQGELLGRDPRCALSIPRSATKRFSPSFGPALRNTLLWSERAPVVSRRPAWPLNVGTESRCWTSPIASVAPCGSRASLPRTTGVCSAG